MFVCCRQGSVTAMKGQISGDPFDLPVPHALLRPVQKTSPSGPWLFPRGEHLSRLLGFRLRLQVQGICWRRTHCCAPVQRTSPSGHGRFREASTMCYFAIAAICTDAC